MFGNLQDQNVGNRGDRAKHAALIHLARGMASRHPFGPLNWLDTHAYRLHAPAGSPSLLTPPVLVGGEYLCSSGLVATLIPHVRFHLSEAHPATRRLLAGQLRTWGIIPVRLLPSLASWRQARELTPAPLLALLDPFQLTAATWQEGVAAVSRLWRAGSDGALLVFDYHKPPNLPAWPPPPPDWLGPVAVWRDPPYHLACYATPSFVGEVNLSPLGWELR